MEELVHADVFFFIATVALVIMVVLISTLIIFAFKVLGELREAAKNFKYFTEDLRERRLMTNLLRLASRIWRHWI